jgi:hypothetical protein
MKLSMLSLLLPLSVAAWWPAKKEPPAPPPASEGGMDMSSTFAKLRTCQSCVAAGYGWCPNRRKCGGFATEGCGEGENYVAVGEPYAAPSSTGGGGGLIAGTALSAHHLTSRCRTIGGEPFAVDDAYRSLKSGIIQSNESIDSPWYFLYLLSSSRDYLGLNKLIQYWCTH